MLLLAQYTPLTPTAQLSLFTLLAVAVAISVIVANLRRKPPIDVDITKLVSSTEQLSKTVTKLEQTLNSHSGHSSRIESLEKECAKLREELAREIQGQRSYTAKTSREIFERIESVEKAVSHNFQSVERALGRLEGMLAPRV